MWPRPTQAPRLGSAEIRTLHEALSREGRLNVILSVWFGLRPT